MKKLIISTLTILISISLLMGCAPTKQTDNTKTTQSQEDTNTSNTPNCKVAINIEGTIDEISEDGTKLKIGDKYVIITDKTVFADDPDNGSVAVPKEFKVGNFIQGYTEDKGSEVKALSIYKNEAKAKIQAKVAVNLSGKIQEVDSTGKRFKIDDKWIIVTDDTRFEDDPDNGVEPVSKELKVGNSITGFTQTDLSTTDLIAVAIYKNEPAQ